MTATPSTGTMVQVHLLTSYPAALLNRDDAGLAKRMPFGDATRTRISSQCLKKHWREATPLDDPETTAVRSRLLFERYVAEPLRSSGLGLTDAEVGSLTQLLVDTILSQKEKGAPDDGSDVEDADEASDEAAKPVQAKQVMVLSKPECEWLTETASDIARLARDAGVALDDASALRAALGAAKGSKSAKTRKGVKGGASGGESTEALAALWKERLATIKALPASVDVALFGRFITSDLLSRVDAAISVAHAITTHAELAETDYFTAVDMLDDTGAGHLNDTELTSGVFYTYVVVDLDQLRANLGPHAERAEWLAARLVRTMATVGPRAKRGSTAPFALAEFVLLERGTDQPRTLANAFRTPVAVRGAPDDDLMTRSIRALLAHRRRLGAMYGGTPQGVAATIHEEAVGDAAPVAPLDAALQEAFGPGTLASAA